MREKVRRCEIAKAKSGACGRHTLCGILIIVMPQTQTATSRKPLLVNSQSKDPSIAAGDAAAKAVSDDSSDAAPLAEAPIEAAQPPRDAARPRQAGPGGQGNREQRLHTIQGAVGQNANGQGPRGQGQVGPGGRGPRFAGNVAFAPNAQPDLQPPIAPSPVRPAQEAAAVPVREPVAAARVRRRHRGIMALAFLLIVVPSIATAVYMWGFAVDQYVSTAGFAIRNQAASVSPFDFLGAFGGGSTSTSSNMDILYNFVGSQQLIQKLDKDIGVQAIYSKPKNDPLFSYDTSGTIEDLVKYWGRMVQVNYDTSTGLMQLSTYAFTPEDAQRVAQSVMDESSHVVNKLAAVARDDTTKYAKEALVSAESKLKDARAALTQFRIANNLVDPTLDITSQSAIVGSLTQQLVQAQVELAMLKQGAAAGNDPRMATLDQRIAIIQSRITEEQDKVRTGGRTGTKGYAEIVSNYTQLSADSEFSERAYMTALAAFDVAETDAQHKQVYLATYEEPTLAQAATAPRRLLVLIAVMVIGFLAWAITTLVYYALRDRR